MRGVLGVSFLRLVLVGLVTCMAGAVLAQEDPATSATDLPAALEAGVAEGGLQAAAARLAELWDAAVADKRVVSCPLDDSPWQAVARVAAEARAIGARGTDAAEQFHAWKRAHRLKYGIEIARDGVGCEGPPVPMIEPSVAEDLLAAADRLIAELDRERRTIDYGTLPPVPVELGRVLQDLVDVFEANFPESFTFEPTDGVPQAPAESELRRLVYAPLVTPRRFDSELVEPLRELVEVLDRAQFLPPEKRDMLRLKAHLALELAEYHGRYSGC